MRRKIDFEKILGRICKISLLIIVPFLAVEFINIYTLPYLRAPIEMEFPPPIYRKPLPYVMFGGTKDVECYHKGERLNSLGYRGKAPLPSKDPDEFRIFVLGGSTIVLGVNTVPDLLEKELRNNGFENVNVYNFGIVSSVSSMEISRILFEISEFSPDLIVMYNGANDIIQPYNWDPRPGYPFNFIAYENNPLLQRDVKHYPTIPLFLYGSSIFQFLFPSYFVQKFVPLEEKRNEVGYKSSEWEDAIAKTYVKNLVKADAISKAFGAEFIVFFQPTLFTKEPLHEEERKMVIPELRDYYLRVYKKIISEIAKQPSELKVIDLSDIFDGDDNLVFRDLCHKLKPRRITVAQEIYKYIEPIIINKIKKNKI